MSRALSNAPGSDSPLKAHLVAKAAYSNAKLTRKENHRELRRDMVNVSLVVEPEKFLELFVPEPPSSAGEKARRKPANPFAKMEKPTTERKMYEEYPKALNKIIRGSDYTFVATPYKADNATDPKLAVDCGMYPRKRVPKKDKTKEMDPKKRKDFRRVCWSGIDLPAECKLEDDPFEDGVDTGRPSSDKRRDASGQALSYLELSFHHQYRTFVFMLIFIGVNCRLLRVDRSGLFVTKRFNVMKTDFLVEFLWRYTQLSPEDRGYDTTAMYINPAPHARDPLAKMMRERLSEVQNALTRANARETGGIEKGLGQGKKDDEEVPEEHIVELWQESLDMKWPWWKLRVTDEKTGQDRWFLTGKPSFQAPGVRGRGTRCHIAVELITDADENHTLAKQFVYLKDCWRVVVDTAGDDSPEIQKEGETLRRLNEANVPHVPTLVAHGDLRGQATQAPDAWKKVNDKHRSRMKRHQHYRLVVEEIGKPLSQFKNSGQLMLVMHDCLQAHSEAFKIGIIHRDISGGNVLLYKDKKGAWRGLLTDWELSKDFRKDSKPRQLGRTGTLQFSAVRILDDPSKTVCVTDEIECFFHVLIYFAVRFLQHNLPDRFVGQFLNNYFDVSSGFTVADELTAPELKRRAMETGRIPIDSCGPTTSLQFMWVNVPPKASKPPASSKPSQPRAAPLAPPNYTHPLNDLISTLLSWFSALYTLEHLNKVVPPNPSQAQGCQGGEVAFIFDDDAQPAPPISPPEPPSPAELARLKDLADNVNHKTVLMLFRQACGKAYPSDKGEDKRPEKGYAPRSPETPQFSSLPGFSDGGEESDDQAEDAPAPPSSPDASAPDAIAAVEEQQYEDRPAGMVVSNGLEANMMDEPEDEGGPRTPSPCPSRPKRGREDDVAPSVLGTSEKRSRC
uniref:Cytochrome P450 monooxygenase AKT7 ) n=1 Tax=Ganoderma boninense TaxID=34458 RepID=A0A5K1JTK5_9APHY|nr:Cytochrome P450 monooxygenase AKT7 (EC (AK-toxin biosynthesis protein 7) [Ganoderma boninense]